MNSIGRRRDALMTHIRGACMRGWGDLAAGVERLYHRHHHRYRHHDQSDRVVAEEVRDFVSSTN